MNALYLKAQEFYRCWLQNRSGTLAAYGWLCLAAFGFIAFNLTLSGDDWPQVHDHQLQRSWVLIIGRWMQGVVWDVFFQGRFVPAMTIAVYSILTYLACALIARPLGAAKHLPFFVLLSTFALSPIVAFHLNLNCNHLILGVGFLLTASAAALLDIAGQSARFSKRTWLLLAAGSLTLCLALACRQSLFFTFAVIAAGILLNRAILQPTGSGETEVGGNAVRAALTFALAAAAAAALYFLVTWCMQRFVVGIVPKLPQYRIGLHLAESLSDFAFTLRRLGAVLRQFFFERQLLWPLGAKAAFLAAAAVWLSLLLSRARAGGWARIGAAAALAALFVLSPWMLGVVRIHPNSYSSRALLGLVPLYPIVLAQSLAACRSLRVQALLLACWAVILLSFVFVHNRVALKTYAINQRDYHTANRMLSRIESHPAYDELAGGRAHEIILISSKPAGLRIKEEVSSLFNIDRPEPLARSNIQCGVFYCLPNRFPFLMQFVDYPNENRTYRYAVRASLDSLGLPPKMYAELVQRLAQAEPWPAASALIFIDSTVFILL